MERAQIERHLERIDADGYTIVEDALSPELTTDLRKGVRNLFAEHDVQPKGNRAEGFATKRLYNLVPRGSIFEELPVQENVLPVVEELLEPELLLSGTTAMDIGPGERLQGLHADDGLFRIGRPHRPMMATTIWALTDFTHDNGATRIVPGSHRNPGHPDPDDESISVPAVMSAGSVLIMDSQLWHCGGANTTEDDWRLGLNVQYVRGFFRTQQNHYLSVPHDKIPTYSERLRQLLGFDLYRGIMGHVEGRSPRSGRRSRHREGIGLPVELERKPVRRHRSWRRGHVTYYSVDIEADGPAPGPYSMLSAGLVAVRHGLADRFYCELKPIGAEWVPDALAVSGLDRAALAVEGEEPELAMARLRDFVRNTTRGRPVFVSDSPGFDFSFVNYYLHVFNAQDDPNPNPFGHSSRRIGDLWAGMAGDASTSSDWKALRETSHTHNALDDAVGNAEALLAIQAEGLTIDLR